MSQSSSEINPSPNQSDGDRQVSYRTPSACDYLGLFYPSLSANPSFDNYYSSLEVLSPRLREAAWVDSCTGFYLNSVDFGLPRVSYFAADDTAPTATMKEICSSEQLLQAKPAQPLGPVEYAPNYGGFEIEFREYLCAYTQVGLDMLASDRPYVQRLFALYCWQVQPSGNPVRSHFEQSFLRSSEVYRSLRDADQDVFWQSFEFCAGAKYTPWSHMFVNMILGLDLLVTAPYSHAEINKFLASRGHVFHLPHSWRSD